MFLAFVQVDAKKKKKLAIDERNSPNLVVWQ